MMDKLSFRIGYGDPNILDSLELVENILTSPLSADSGLQSIWRAGAFASIRHSVDQARMEVLDKSGYSSL
jgi:hypothetical protein